MIAPSGLTAAKINNIKINLAWTNGETYSHVQIYRKPSGGAYTLLYEGGGTITSYSDSFCQDGTKYYYKVRGRNHYPIPEPDEYSDYSNEADATTSLLAPTGLYGSATNTTVTLFWNDNCQNESGFKVYKNGIYLATVGTNIETYIATGLSEGTYYDFKVKAYNAIVDSNFSNIETILTADPPTKPDSLISIATGTTTARLNWADRSSNEIDFHIERSAVSASAGFAQIGTVDKNIITYADSGLVSNTQYWYRVRAHNASGYSAYCIVATIVTWAAIAIPTDLIVTAISNTVIDIRFTDNSELEDFHCVERKDGAGAYAEVIQLEPNRTFWRNTGLTAGHTYTYKIRAKQGAASYSGYSDEVAATMLAVPTAPTGLAVSEYQDTWLRLTWIKTTGETGYRIARSTPDEAGYAIIATVTAGVEYYKVTGLTPGIKYYFKVLAYNGAGNGSYCASVNQTTRTTYLRSKFEKLIRKSKAKLNFHIEANPSMIMSGWTLSLGVYSTSFDERGAEIDAVYEDGVALTWLDDPTGEWISAYPGHWYYNKTTKRLNINPFDGFDPSDRLITASFWIYASTAKEQVFNEHDYLPLIASDGIPDITQEMQQYYGDNFIITSGTVSLINGWLNKEFFFDRRFEKYIWLNRKMKILAGGEGFTYAELQVINTGIINSVSITDQRINFDLRDYRGNLHRMLPVEKYSIDVFPLLDSNAAGKVRPFGFGTLINIIPTCIDTTNRRFEFHNGQCKSVTALTLNAVALAENTDFFVDYGLGRFTLARGLAYATDDILLISFHAMTNSADEEIEKPAEVFKYILNEKLDVPDTDLNLDSIYATNLVKTTALQLYIWKEIGSQEIIRTIEQSSMTYSFQDASGRLGLRTQQTTAPSDIKYIPKSHVLNFSMNKNPESIYAILNMYYGEDYSMDKFSIITKTVNTMIWLYNVSKSLDIYIALASATDANTLADLVIADLNKKQITFDVPRMLYNSFPGDLVYFNRDRFPSTSGTANNLLLRILAISKAYTSGQTKIKAEIV